MLIAFKQKLKTSAIHLKNCIPPWLLTSLGVFENGNRL